MRTYSCLYKGAKNLKLELCEAGFQDDDVLFISIYTGTFDMNTAVEEAKKIKELLPNVQIFGATANAVTCNNEQYKEGTLVLVEKFIEGKVNSKIINYQGLTPESLAKRVRDHINKNDSKIARILIGGAYENPHEFVDFFNELGGADIKLTGGIAGDTTAPDTIPFIFNEEEAVTYGLVVAAFSKNIHAYCDCSTSHEAISNIHTLTKSDGIYWDEIDEEDAVEWIKKYLNIETLSSHSSWQDIIDNDPLVKFEAVLEGHNGSSRFLKYVEKENRMALYASTVPEGTKFRIGYSSPSKCVEKCYQMCCDIRRQPIESLIHFSCLFRMMYMNNCAKWEISPFANYNMNGAFLLGEIGWKDTKNEFFNGAMILSGLAEGETYIIPDFDVFSKLNDIKLDNEDLMKFVFKKQMEVKSSENENLLEKLIAKQEKIKSEMMMNINLGINNLIKFQEDKDKYGVDKICAIQIENTDMLITSLGLERYYSLVREFLKILESTLRNIDGDFYIYSITNSAVAIVAGRDFEDEAFLKFTKKIHKMYQFFKFNSDSTPIINRFCVVTNQKYLVEVAMNLFQANKSSQSHYIISHFQEEVSISIKDELKMINIINRALERDSVVPFYQGIRDNVNKNTTSYEALMRIIDVDGTIYSPLHFMDISKKYYMYRRLSDKMIERVFQDVAKLEKDTIVSINISALDIESDEFMENISFKISQLSRPEGIVFEILEDESFDDIGRLKKLIDVVRGFGCKIAIDDFGKGYSNLLEITKIKPDYIKIDGGIIKESHCNTNSEIVVKTIIYLANQLQMNLVAEFVENEEIQKVMEKLNVRYSQGYLFSRPSPLESVLEDQKKKRCPAF